MNERIKELEKQATTIMVPEFGEFAGKEFHYLDKEKFAELIVKECAEVAHCNFHVDGLTLGGILKEHFGLE